MPSLLAAGKGASQDGAEMVNEHKPAFRERAMGASGYGKLTRPFPECWSVPKLQCTRRQGYREDPMGAQRDCVPCVIS
jgi:hypothetical protein